MVLQFKDTVDILKVMHPEFDFISLFDQRPDSLYQHRMNNKAFGGKAALMRDTLIQQEEDFLGQFPQILQSGAIQSMVLLPGLNTGPFWMSEAEKEDYDHDKHLGTTTEVKLAALELILQLCQNGV
jgi:hypothetical protein